MILKNGPKFFNKLENQKMNIAYYLFMLAIKNNIISMEKKDIKCIK